MAISGRRALITGFTGQDGTFLTRHLLDEGYQVIGLTRRVSTEPPLRVRGKFDFTREIYEGRLVTEAGDLESISSLLEIIRKYQPHQVYNLAAQSHVGLSFEQPENTINSTFLGVVNLITALESEHLNGNWRMYQASTSEMFGNVDNHILNEDSRLDPVSPYAIAKMAAHQYCKMKRNQGQFISCGILFNHESEIRGGDFVTQKIARAVAKGEPLSLGNLEAKRDWGYAGDYVKAMRLILERDKADDYIVGTGETHSVREFVEAAYRAIGKTIKWRGEGLAEVGLIDDVIHVRIDDKFYRPNEVPYLLADHSKITHLLGWEPEHTFEQIVKLMVEGQK